MRARANLAGYPPHSGPASRAPPSSVSNFGGLCLHKILTESGETISFCEYNVLHRGRKRCSGTIKLAVREQRVGSG